MAVLRVSSTLESNGNDSRHVLDPLIELKNKVFLHKFLCHKKNLVVNDREERVFKGSCSSGLAV